MGVPSYFYWLVKKYEDLILSERYQNDSMGDSGGDNQIDYLYLDLNCAIHPAVKERPMELEDMFPAVWDYLVEIVSVARPRKALYIAIDGVAPAAKMKQQRTRRYKAVQDKELVNRLKRKYRMPVEEGHDFNMISPGTEFMTRLSEYLQREIKRATTAGVAGGWAGRFKVIFSDASVPGEGEHKIMDHIRSQTTESDNLVVYGLDSDLIFLCLANHRPGMALVRERQYFGKQAPPKPDPKTGRKKTVYNFLLIDQLRDCLVQILNPYVSVHELESHEIFNKYHQKKAADDYPAQVEAMMKDNFYQSGDQQRLIDDYVFMCFLLGNDFLPHMTSLKIKDGGLDELLISYKIVQARLRQYLIEPMGDSGDRKINVEFLKILLYELSLIESSFLQQQTKSRHHRVKGYERRAEQVGLKNYELELEDMEYVENKYHDPIQLGYGDDWKEKYYYYHFHFHPQAIPFEDIPVNDEQSARRHPLYQICWDYLNGLRWTLLYYYQNCPNWSWVYPFESAPCVSDLLTALNWIDPNKLDHPKNDPVGPFQQLMSILPPQSSALLPAPLGQLMRDPDSGLIQMYPIKVKLNMYHKKYRWECHPILPELRPHLIAQLIRLNRNRLTESERKRNEKRDVQIY